MVAAVTETSPELDNALPLESLLRVSRTAPAFSATDVALTVMLLPESNPATVTAPGAAPVASSMMLPDA